MIPRLLGKHPSNHRDWKPDVERMPYGEVTGDTLTLRNVRNTRYGPPGEPYEVVWEDRSYDLGKIKRLWLAVEPFHPTITVIAHTFISFEFEDDFLALSIEARMEKGETYSIARGFIGDFELIYSYGDERDFIVRRTHFLDHDLYLYPLVAPPGEVREVFLRMLRTANELTHKPRFYHSVTDNCTSRLMKHANEVRPGSFLPFIPAQVLPGLSDGVLYRKGWIDTNVPLERLRDHYNVREKAEEFRDEPGFSERIREGM